MYSLEKTIIACSTSLSLTTAIGIIRISGKDILAKIDPYLTISKENIKPRFAHFIKVLDQDKSIIDEVVFLFFKGPHSYTGEDVVEIHSHGNPIILNKLISLFVEQCGFVEAHEGEFTYRALKNKKMSLNQVEGLDLLIHGKNDYVLKEGKSLLSGELNELYTSLYDQFLDLKSCLEILINFTEDIDENYASQKFKQSFKLFFENINRLYQRVSLNGSKILKPKIVLSGKPNAGKSTFFNRFIGNKRSIVSEEAGTTRDYISEQIFINGNEFELIDTAGLRETSNKIEQQGVVQSEHLISTCFYNILVIDLSEKNILESIEDNARWADLVIVNKIDLDKDNRLNLLSILDSSKINSLNHSIDREFDFNELKQLIIRKFNNLTKTAPILLERHGSLIKEIHLNSLELHEVAEDEYFDAGLISAIVLRIQENIESLIGVLSSDEVLDNIFSNYCIGK